MRRSRSLSDWLLYRQVATLTRAQEFGRRLKNIKTDEKGQTPTEYLMIVGLMAAVILLAFVTFFWGTIRSSAQNWSGKVGKAIEGENVK